MNVGERAVYGEDTVYLFSHTDYSHISTAILVTFSGCLPVLFVRVK